MTIFGNSVASIGSWAFGECKSLINITIPDSVKNIEVSVFSGCISLKSIIFNGTKVQWNTINKDFLWNDGIDDITVHCTDGDITTN